jgi:hypothetical protein
MASGSAARARGPHANAVSAARGQSSDFSASRNGRGIDIVRGVSVLYPDMRNPGFR